MIVPAAVWKAIGPVWLTGCLAGSYVAMSYDFTPGRLGAKRDH